MSAAPPLKKITGAGLSTLWVGCIVVSTGKGNRPSHSPEGDAMTTTDIYAMTAEELTEAHARIEERFSTDRFTSAFDREQSVFELQRINALLGKDAPVNGPDKSKWNYVSKSRVVMPIEDFDASALDDIQVTRTEKSITVRIGNLVTLSRDTKVPYAAVVVMAFDVFTPEFADLSVKFTKGQPIVPNDVYGNPPMASATATIPD